NVLFKIDTNILIGCWILKYYLEMERFDLVRGLARYNGSVGQTWYADRVVQRLNRKWYRFCRRSAALERVVCDFVAPLLDRHLAPDGRRPPYPEPRGKLGQPRSVPCGDDLDPPVGQVARPAPEPEAQRLLPRRAAKIDALHLAADEVADRLHRHRDQSSEARSAACWLASSACTARFRARIALIRAAPYASSLKSCSAVSRKRRASFSGPGASSSADACSAAAIASRASLIS